MMSTTTHFLICLFAILCVYDRVKTFHNFDIKAGYILPLYTTLLKHDERLRC